jgi:hypothetical protein
VVALTTGKSVENVTMGVLNPLSQKRVWIKVSATPVVLPGDEKHSYVYTIFHDSTTSRELCTVEKEDGQ